MKGVLGAIMSMGTAKEEWRLKLSMFPRSEVTRMVYLFPEVKLKEGVTLVCSLC